MTVIAFIIGVLLLVVGLAVSIGLHEIGHLVPAKLFGVRVGKYMIGFGPTLWSRRIGETEYGIKALPLGGYISMAGMYPRSPDAGDAATARERTPGRFFSAMVQDARAATDTPILNRVSSLLGILGALNIALFVFNLIPLLPLDGGHVVVALWDGLKRAWAKLFRRPPPRPVDATRLVPVTFVVVIALAVMGGVLILADIVNPVQLLG